METKITVGQTPTHLSPTHSTPIPYPGGVESRVISHVSTGASSQLIESPPQSPRSRWTPPQRGVKALKVQLVQNDLSDGLAVGV